MALISIITINYNNAPGLEQTIQSVIKQTLTHFQFIIIDGGSTDESVEIIKKHQEKISYWVSEKDRGIYHAMNKGTLVVKEGYCYYLNSGDIFYNDNVLAAIAPSLNGADLVAGSVEFVSGSGEKKIWKTKGQYRVSEVAYGHLPHQGFFFRRDVFDRVGFYNENLKIVSDWELLLKMVINNVTIQNTDIVFATHFSGGISNEVAHITLQADERERVLKSLSSLKEDLHELFLTRSLLRYFLHRIKASIRYRMKGFGD